MLKFFTSYPCQTTPQPQKFLSNRTGTFIWQWIVPDQEWGLPPQPEAVISPRSRNLEQEGTWRSSGSENCPRRFATVLKWLWEVKARTHRRDATCCLDEDVGVVEKDAGHPGPWTSLKYDYGRPRKSTKWIRKAKKSQQKIKTIRTPNCRP